MAKLTGKVALITGAAVGLGEGIATAYAKYGAKLCMVDLSPEVEKTAEKLRKEYNAEIVTCVANVADPEQMKAAAAKAAEASVVVGDKVKKGAKVLDDKGSVAVDKGSRALGKQLGKTRGMFKAFKDEYQKASGGSSKATK